ncbi:DUF1007 family protein [Maridesulfovibrio ferrireducens]|uniref:DUF1007 family protein n=1 Tax=Maridesulfovibrio ferrireducens TaxID=246191 RepID=UPI0026ECA628|nr:DUF1007 family protein [Maridesulfovibrio ferrireducens]
MTLFVPNQAIAHPHVFVDSSLTFEFDSLGLKGVRQKWWFDEMFASMILGEFDADHNNKLSKEEAKALKEGAFVNLKNFNYFTTILVDGQPYTITEATEFIPSIEGHTLVYNFFIPCNVKENDKKHTIVATNRDETLYTAFQIDPKNKIKNLPETLDAQLDFDIVEELTSPITQMAPEAAFLTFGPK